MRPAVRLAFLLLFLAPAPLFAQRATGDWTGAIEVPGSPLAIEVTLTGTDDAPAGTISIPAQNLRGFALAGVRVAGDSVFFQMDGIPGLPTFRGALKDGDKVLAGDFLQGGARLDFSLTRAAAAHAEAAEQDARALAGFDSLVAAAIGEWRVPGVGLALVRGADVIYEKGYGVRDVASGAPVTPQTRFAIGSATKAFTALTLATLNDEGKLDWDKPVIEYLPDFRLHDPVATQGMTANDLLTHRSGLPRHDLLWYSTPFSRDELYHRLRYLEPTKPFRGAWQYQNLMFMTAGILAERLGGAPWETLVQTRIFDPLGMTGASLDMASMQAAGDHATGYGGGRDSANALPPFTLDAIGPAGSINAGLVDMEKWVALQLSDGEVEGRRVVSAANLKFLHTPQVFVAAQATPASPYLMYAPGWFAEVYRGHRLVQHGGNIDGFSALVGLLPDDDLGVVILTNKDGSPVPRALMLSAFDRLLGLEKTDWLAGIRPAANADSLDGVARADREAQRVPGTKPSHPLADYAGLYEHPAYGQMSVRQQNGGLHATYYKLDEPLTHWHYDTFEIGGGVAEGMKLTFQTNPDGLVDGLSLAIEPTLPPVTFKRQAAPVSPEMLAQYAGRYRLETLTITVAVRGDGLAMTVPGQPTYALEATPEAHTFGLESLNGYRVRFEMDGGKAARIVLLQPNGTFRAERVD